MVTSATATLEPGSAPAQSALPLLEAGDRLSREEFERRYEQMPHLKKAELVEGTVYMPSPIRYNLHAEPHSQLGTWLGYYASETPGVRGADNATVRLDLDNEPQPDLLLLKLPAKGGQARISADDYVEGAPELVIEIVGSSRAYDLHPKKAAYRRNGVREVPGLDHGRTACGLVGVAGGGVSGDRSGGFGSAAEWRVPRPLARYQRLAARRYEGRVGRSAARTR